MVFTEIQKKKKTAYITMLLNTKLGFMLKD